MRFPSLGIELPSQPSLLSWKIAERKMQYVRVERTSYCLLGSVVDGDENIRVGDIGCHNA